MAQLSVVTGATSIKTRVFIQDSSVTTGAGLTGLVFNTGSLTAYYHKEGASSATAISLVTATLGTFTSSGFIVVDGTNMPGLYEIGIPNAALDTAGFTTIVLKGASNMVETVIGIYVQADNPQVAKPSNFNLTSIDSNGRLDIIKIAGTTQTARDIGASVLLSSGSGTGQLDFTSGVVKANATQWLGGTIPAVNVTGVPLVDAKYLLGTIFATPATAGIIDANVKNMNNVAATSITTINANQGTTQPVNFTGTAGSALVKSDMVDIAGAAVSTSTAQIGVNTVNLGGTAQTGRDIGASVLLSSGTGTGQLDFTSGVVKANLAQILGTALTETAGLLAGGFKKFFNVATPTGTLNSIPDAVAGAANGLFIAGTNAATTVTTSLTTTFTGNLTGSVGSVSGNVGGNVTGSVGSVVGAVGSVTGAVGSVTGNVGGNVTGSVGSVSGNVGGNVVGTVASVVGNVGGDLVGDVQGSVLGNVDGSVDSVTDPVTVGTNNDKTGYTLSTAGIDAILTRDLANIDTASIPCLGWAAAALANASDLTSIDADSADLTVYQSDSTTPLFAKSLTLASGINPITAQTIGV